MKPQTLAPIRDKDKYAEIVQKKLEYELYRQIYQPILAIFGLSLRQVAPGRTNAKERRNAKPQGLFEAIQAGTVTYSKGVFQGKITAAISKELKAMGGVFDKRKRAWVVKDMMKAPAPVAHAVQKAKEESHEKIEAANKALDKVQKEGLSTIDLMDISEGILGDLEKQFQTTAAEKLEIPMAMSGFIANELKETYTENLNLYIKTWADDAIVRLRGQIQTNAEGGYRAANMVEAIRAEYGVSLNKAKFLATQETSLLVSKYREETYKEAGVPFYQWSTSHDRRVRQDHKDLNGQIFRWDSPPVTDKARGSRNHPGCDFGCRCIAIPVLERQMAKVA